MSLVTKPFRDDAEVTAKIFGMPNVSIAIMDASTLSNLKKQEIEAISDQVFNSVLEKLVRTEITEEPGIGEEQEVQYGLEEFLGSDAEQAWEVFNRNFMDNGWGDGFPLIPPTEEKVEQMLKGVNRNADEVVTILEPGMGIATVKILVINAVMAGCEPKHVPVLIAAVKGMSEPAYRLRTVAMSTGPHTPMLLVNGPIVKELKINSGRGALGPGKDSWANTVIGRAIRLILMNVGHAYVGTMDLDTLGSPLKYSLCVAENEDASPWEPYHVSFGYHKEENTVTVFGVESQFEINDMKNCTPEGILTSYAGTINSIGALFTRSWLIPRRRSDSPVLISPDHAKVIADAGWDKEDIQAFLFAKAQLPAKLYKNTVGPDRLKPGCRWVMDAPDDMLLPIVGSPDWYHVIVVGGPAGKSSFMSGVGKAVTKKIELEAGYH